MNKANETKWSYGMRGALMAGLAVLALTACSDDDGLSAGDPDYFTSSRGQFTATIDDGNGGETTLFLIPGTTPGTAVVTYDGSNPRHWQAEQTATVRVGTYQNELVIPETVTAGGATYTITGIGAEAFTGCRVYTANGVTYWNGLTAVTLPESVATIGDGAFALTDVADINIPQAVTSLPMGCFGNCTKLASITVPAHVRTIGQMAYYGCSGATSLTLEEGVEHIGEMAFFDCNKLTEVTIPASVKTIGNMAFGGRENRRSKVAAYHMLPTTPPVLEGTLYQAAEGIAPIVYVPVGTAAAYQTAAGWSELNIEEEVTE
ncbi:MAG: leucine-rich repeat domain-containing protein [Prevotella sp.]|nr:leucine-rich repeat domain-containing protein [Prevotella sp.]